MKILEIDALKANVGSSESNQESCLKLLHKGDLTDRYVVVAGEGSGLDYATDPKIGILEMTALLSWNDHYRRDRSWKMIAPGSVYWVAQKV